jgi:hypothetical protein
MSTNWRISSFNGALLAAYFIPTWTIVAFKIMSRRSTASMSGRTYRSRCSSAIICNWPHDHGPLRLAAGAGKLTVVAFFAIFCIHHPRLDPQEPAAATKRWGWRLRSAA